MRCKKMTNRYAYLSSFMLKCTICKNDFQESSTYDSTGSFQSRIR